MKGPDKCPLCGGAVDHDREVEELVRDGGDVAVVRVRADVCGDCGEAMFHPGMVERLSAARATLREGNVAPASAIGRVYDLGSA